MRRYHPHGLFKHVVTLAQAAEAAGFDIVTVMDHFYQIRGVGPETEPMLEAYTTLAALAASTSHIQLATLVTGVTYRNPALLAKTVTNIDVISWRPRHPGYRRGMERGRARWLWVRVPAVASGWTVSMKR